MYQIGIDIGGTNVKIGLLDEALDGIDESNSKRIDKYDIYYTGDMAKWRRLGNSLKLKFYMYLANKEDVGDEIKAILTSVYNSLQEKGYNPINQIVGYILSEDPTYITTHNNARSLIRKIDRDELLKAMVRTLSLIHI